MTPLEGLIMGSRAGDIDTGAVIYLMEREGYDLKAVSDMLNKQSGLLGISGISSDIRDVHDAIDAGNERAKLAVAMFNYRIKKYIGSYVAALGGLDVLVFTGGIGENDDIVRRGVCKDMEFFGIKIDDSINDGLRGSEKIISTEDSRVIVMTVPTDEEYMIALDTLEIVKN